MSYSTPKPSKERSVHAEAVVPVVRKERAAPADGVVHARFHDAMSITLGSLVGSTSLYFLHRRWLEDRAQLAFAGVRRDGGVAGDYVPASAEHSMIEGSLMVRINA